MGLQQWTVYTVPFRVAERWWEILRIQDAEIEVRPPLGVAVPTEFDGIGYRLGKIRRGDVCVSVMPSPGQRNPANVRFAGVSLILLGPPSPKTPEADSLMKEIDKQLQHAGGQLVEREK